MQVHAIVHVMYHCRIPNHSWTLESWTASMATSMVFFHHLILLFSFLLGFFPKGLIHQPVATPIAKAQQGGLQDPIWTCTLNVVRSVHSGICRMCWVSTFLNVTCFWTRSVRGWCPGHFKGYLVSVNHSHLPLNRMRPKAPFLKDWPRLVVWWVVLDLVVCSN